MCSVRNDILHCVFEDSESSLYTQLSLGCQLNGLVNQPHFFLAQSSLHVTVHDAVAVAHFLSPVGKHTEKSYQVRRQYWETESLDLENIF